MVVTLSFTPLSIPTLPLSLKPPSSPKLKPLTHQPSISVQRSRTGICSVDLSGDTPYGLAIGACILSSLVLPNNEVVGDDESPMDSTDTRFGVMGIISFIPYFNWLSWLFAWLDIGKRRYAIYSLIYLAPYLRSNMSLSLEDSWLPIVSILLGIIHVQLEASIRNGDIKQFQAVNEIAKFLSSVAKGKNIDFDAHNGLPGEGQKRKHRNLTSAEEHSGDELLRTKPSRHHKHEHPSNGDFDE